MSNDFIELACSIVDKQAKGAMTKALAEVLFQCDIGVKALEYNHGKQIVTVEFYDGEALDVNVHMDSPKALMLDVLKVLKAEGYL